MSIKEMTPDALRRYVQTHGEGAYVLVDVRQPQEYQLGHIPGARLVPLPELVRDMARLPADKELVVYCHSGARSMAAATMLAEEGFQGPIYNLSGGMMHWDGFLLADQPRVDLVAGQSLAEMYQTALNLEKGAQIFYETVSREDVDQPSAQVFARLAEAEIAHARTVYGFWQQAAEDIDPFDAVYARCSGEVIEGGMSLQAALERAGGMRRERCLRLIELALLIEYAAFDLYRTLADRTEAPAAGQAFLKLAQAEKAHMQALIDAIEGCEA